MSRRRATLMSTQEKVANGLSGEKVRLTFTARRPMANVETRHIMLPPVPEEVSPETETKVRAWTDHESAHIRYGSKPWEMDLIKDKVLRKLAFGFEDIRVDRKNGEDFPGTLDNRRRMFDIVRPELGAANVLQAALWSIYEITKGYYEVEPSAVYWTERVGNPAAYPVLVQMMRIVEDQINRLRVAETQDEVIDISREIKDIWHELFKQGQKQGKGQGGEDDKMHDGGMFGDKPEKQEDDDEQEQQEDKQGRPGQGQPQQGDGDDDGDLDDMPEDVEDGDGSGDGDEQESEDSDGSEDESDTESASDDDKGDSDEDGEGDESDGDDDADTGEWDSEDGEDADESDEGSGDGDDEVEGDESEGDESDDAEGSGDESDDDESDDLDGESGEGDSDDDESDDEGDGSQNGDADDDESDDESNGSGSAGSTSDDDEDGDESEDDESDEDGDESDGVDDMEGDAEQHGADEQQDEEDEGPSDEDVDDSMDDMVDDMDDLSEKETDELEKDLINNEDMTNEDLHNQSSNAWDEEPPSNLPPGFVAWAGDDRTEDIEPSDAGLYRYDDNGGVVRKAVGYGYQTITPLEFRAEVKSKIGTLQRRLMLDLQSKKRMWVKDRTRGIIDDTRLDRLFTGDRRCMKRKLRRPALNLAVTSLLDCSNSMQGYKMYLCGQIGYIIAETLSALNIAHEALGFTSLYQEARGIPHGVYYHRRSPLHQLVIKPFGMTKRPEMLRRFYAAAQFDGCGTPMGEPVIWAAKRLAARPEPRKILIVICDGEPFCGGPTDAHPVRFQEFTKVAVDRVEASGIDVIGVGIQTATIHDYIKRSVHYAGLGTLLTDFYRLFAKLLRGERTRQEDALPTT